MEKLLFKTTLPHTKNRQDTHTHTHTHTHTKITYERSKTVKADKIKHSKKKGK